MTELLLHAQRANDWGVMTRQVFFHVTISVLAVTIAFSLPAGAQYILYQWWPIVADDANLLIASEIALALALIMLFNAVYSAVRNSYHAGVAGAAALVYAREEYTWLTNWQERRLVRRLPAARDAFILTLTGHDTFVDESSALREPLRNAYEIRVMLLNPWARGAQSRVDSLPVDVTRQTYVKEVEATIACLAELRKLRKKVSLKFYEREPFWKIAVLGDHAWVQYCHGGFEMKREPEYVFALNRTNPRRGFFVPFYMYFLELWEDPGNLDYDFGTGELVEHGVNGIEMSRVPFGSACQEKKYGNDAPLPV